MKKATRILALVLCAVMCLGLFVGCGNKGKQNNDTPLVVGYSPFNSKFSPFFSETAYDQDVWVMTAISLLNGDRRVSKAKPRPTMAPTTPTMVPLTARSWRTPMALWTTTSSCART